MKRVTAANGLRIREGPSTSSRILAVAPLGTVLETGGESAGWYEVRAPWRGYAWGRYLVDAGNDEQAFVFTHWPADSQVITQRWGANPEYYRQFGLEGHEGVDIRAPHGSPIYAAAAGVVKVVITERLPRSAGGHNYGVHVRIWHGQGYETIYAHLHCAGVVVGQQVEGGRVLGLADDTGNSFGSHLHLSLKHHGTFVNPEPFLWPLRR